MQKKDLLEGMLLYQFSSIPDPRVEGRCKHRLFDILVAALCAVASGCTSWPEVEEFAEQREDWLRSFLNLENGIPSHDTFERVFSLLEPAMLEAAILDWSLALSASRKYLSIDGKSVAGSHRGFAGSGEERPLHLLNVFCQDSSVALAQVKATGPGYGEIDAALEILNIIALKGALVTVDAAMSVKRITDKIVEKKGDYLVPIKGNQKFYLSEMEAEFKERGKGALTAQVREESHGRTETRTARVLGVKSLSEKFLQQWDQAKTIIHLIRIREEEDTRYTVQKRDARGKNYYEVNDGKERRSEQNIYFISSRNLTAEEALIACRAHWSIESKLHWGLDVVFLEDQCRVREKRSAENLSSLRKVAFNFFKKCPQMGSMKVKMKRAAFNPTYLEGLLLGTGLC